MTIEEWEAILDRAAAIRCGLVDDVEAQMVRPGMSTVRTGQLFYGSLNRSEAAATSAACVAEAVIERLLLAPDARLVGAMLLTLSPEDRDGIRVLLDALAVRGDKGT